MEFNLGFKQGAMDVFSVMEANNYENWLVRGLPLDSNNVFSRSLIVDIESEEIEIPVIARRHFESIIYDKVTCPSIMGTKQIVLPLYNNAPSKKIRTFDSIVRHLFSDVNYSKRLQKIITAKDEVYYGGKGIIFDENYTPLLLCTLTAKNVHTDSNVYMAYYRPICHVNPKVFVESNKLVNKGIIKKLIPLYTSENINSILSNTGFIDKLEDRKVKVIVDDFDNFFVKPIKPTPSPYFNDVLNECLIDNIDDIIRLIKYDIR